jgi:hypothetical protein
VRDKILNQSPYKGLIDVDRRVSKLKLVAGGGFSFEEASEEPSNTT